MIKKVVALILALGLMATLVGCFGGSDDDCPICGGSGYYQKKDCPVC